MVKHEKRNERFQKRQYDQGLVYSLKTGIGDSIEDDYGEKEGWATPKQKGGRLSPSSRTGHTTIALYAGIYEGKTLPKGDEVPSRTCHNSRLYLIPSLSAGRNSDFAVQRAVKLHQETNDPVFSSRKEQQVVEPPRAHTTSCSTHMANTCPSLREKSRPFPVHRHVPTEWDARGSSLCTNHDNIPQQTSHFNP